MEKMKHISNKEHVSKWLQKYHKLPDLGCCICFFILTEERVQLEIKHIRSHEAASIGEETT